MRLETGIQTTLNRNNNLMEQYNEIIMDAVMGSEPTLLFAPRMSGKTSLYEIIKKTLYEVSEKEILEINISFEKREVHTKLQEALETKDFYSELIDYFENSKIFDPEQNETIVLIDNVEVLEDDDLRWLLRNCLNLTYEPTRLKELGIILIVEGTLSPAQVAISRNSPFVLELKYPRSISKNQFKKFIMDYLEDYQFNSDFIDNLHNFTDGDIYFSERILGIIKREFESAFNIDNLLSAIKKYTKLGACDDPLKYWNIINNKNELNNLDDIIEFVNKKWSHASPEFIRKCYLGGIVRNEKDQIIFRSPDLVRMIYKEALNREINFTNILNSEITIEILPPQQIKRINKLIPEMCEQAFLGFISQFIAGRSQRRNDKELNIEGTYNFSNHIELTWNNEDDLDIGDEAFFLLLDYTEKKNESIRNIYFFPL